MSDPERWRDEVDTAVLATLAEVGASLVHAGRAGAELTQVITHAAEGGKRTRSTMLLASHHAHGGPDHRSAVTMSAALELFHTAALVHDDVLDSSDTRRGRPSARRELAAAHAEGGWLGDASAFGDSGAILAGDLALMASHRALLEATRRLEPAVANVATETFLAMADLVTAGQYLDMRTAAQPLDALPEQEADIRAIMRSKTASYTCEAPLLLGASLAGADARRRAKLGAIGVPLGVAFQLRDDLLGLAGTPEDTGKPAGDDLREGKRTLAVWYAWTRGTDRQRAAIERALGRRGASDDQVGAAVEAIRATGAIDAVEAEIADLRTRARTALGALDLAEPFAGMLDAMAVAATARDR